MTDATLGHIAPAGLAALAAFADRLDEPVGEWKGGDTLDEDAISMPWFAASAMVNDFVAAAYEHGLVVPFGWSDWMSDGGQLRGVAEQDEQREYLAQVVELALVQHRRLVDQADVQRILAPLPALDEVRPAQPRRRQRAGDRAVALVKGERAVQRRVAQPLDHGALAVAGQPFR